MNFRQKIKPGIDKKWLHLTAGLMWSGVGIFLCSLAYGWLVPVDIIPTLLLALSGVLLAIVIYKFGFSKLAKENIHRIIDLPAEKPCIFAFQNWTSYPLVAVMISLGIFLRTSSLIPKLYLAAMYLGIGGSLFLASFHYYHFLLEARINPSKIKI
ncbi:MAG: hypothetical protein ISS57_02735 [Anaerolineales bacterium]|nr:hypothetical protein [Anaerolineales bacterium]